MSASLAAADRDDEAACFLVRAQDRWEHAGLIAKLLAVDPLGLGGAWVRGGASPARRAWMKHYRAWLPEDTGFLDITGNTDEAQVLGGLDVVTSLSEGRPVLRRGVASRAAGQTLCVRMADQLGERVAHELAAAIDRGEEHSFSLILYDESIAEKTALEPLSERVAFALDLDGIPSACLEPLDAARSDIERARTLLPDVSISDDRRLVVSEACTAMGIPSLRADLFAVRCAKALAALQGRLEVSDEDVAEAAKFVLTPRARSLPAADTSEPEPMEQSASGPEQDPPTDDQAQAEQENEPEGEGSTELNAQELQDLVAEAVASGLVSLTMAPAAPRSAKRRSSAGKAGQTSPSQGDGRPIGSRPGDPRRGGKLDILATLRAAVPWQRLRPAPTTASRVRIYPSDLRIKRFAARTGTTVIFAVDASGSSAAARLAEVKGAVETLLGECYARRDQVSLIAFRGSSAEEILPPSRSLTRARRAMIGLPGGGGTPLASAMDLALRSALSETSEGRAPMIVFLSDGQGNIALDGTPGRPGANGDVQRLAPQFRAMGADVLFFDTSKRPQSRVRSLAEDMGARYVAMPYAQHNLLTETVRQEREALQASLGR